MIFRQFCATDKQQSYLFADPVTRRAALLDPHVQLEEAYREVIEHLDLTLVVVIDSHAHESHLSAAPILCGDNGATWITSPLMDTAGNARTVEHGEVLVLGEECFDVIATPGHSPCSLSFHWRDCVFTGHTLLAGRAGPCNRSDSDPRQLYDSIHSWLYRLPAQVRVFPGQRTALPSSTIGREMQFNVELKRDTRRNAFVARKALDRPGAAGMGGTLVAIPPTRPNSIW